MSFPPLNDLGSAAAAVPAEPAAEQGCGASPVPSRRARVRGVVVPKLLPLLALLDTIQPHVASESVFHTRRKKIQAHLALVRAELQQPRPKRQVLTHAVHTLTELVREEARDISKDEVKQAAKEVVLATLQHAPALLNAAHQARLLS